MMNDAEEIKPTPNDQFGRFRHLVEKLAIDPEAERVNSTMQRLLPVKIAGASALVAGADQASATDDTPDATDG